MNFLKGKKTYLTMIAIIILGAIDIWNGVCGVENSFKFCFNIDVPESVYIALGALGILTRKVAKP